MRSDRRALIVGIESYQVLDALKYAVSDATTIEAELKSYSSQFSCRLLLNDDASSKAIREAFRALFEDADDNAVLMFFYAGHAVTQDMGTFLITLNSEDDFESGVHYSRLVEIIRSLRKPHQTVILLLDCCHAGALHMENLAVSLDSIQDAISSIPSVALIAATEGHSLAKERDDLQQGVFTYWLFMGLSGGGADDTGNVTISSLYHFIATSMAKMTNQKPVLKSNIVGAGPLLSQGHPPQMISTTNQLSDFQMEEIDTRTREVLQLVRRNIEVSKTQWMSEIYSNTSRIFSDLLNWRGNLSVKYPELKKNANFNQYNTEIHRFRSELSYIDIDFRTEAGVVTEVKGHGGFGSVYVVQKGQEKSAYKIYHASYLHDTQKISAFKRGYNAMRKLDHPNIIQVHSETEAPLGFYMQYIDGPNFREWWSEDLTKTMKILHIIAQTLEHAHQRSVVHRDIKPENIIIDNTDYNNPVPYLTDFDLAWYSMATTFSTSESVVAAFGNILYSAPEQYENIGAEITRKPTTDVYGFGQLCYFAVTGNNPVRESTQCIATLKQRLRDWGVAEAATKFIEMYRQCTRHTPSERYKSMNDVSSRILDIRNLLSDPDRTSHVSTDRFLQELYFALFGLDSQPSRQFRSRTGSVQIELQNLSDEKVEIRFEAIREFVGPTGTYDEQRNTINKRVDDVISQYRRKLNIHIHRQNTRDAGIYNIRIDLFGRLMSLNGALECRNLINEICHCIEA